MSDLSQSWVISSVKDITNLIQYGYTAKASPNGTSRYLRITDIQDHSVVWSNVPQVEIAEKDLAKYSLNQGDIVFARTGATAGKSFLLSNPPEGAVFASYLIRLEPNINIVNPHYLYYYFQSPSYWNEVIDQAVGAAQPNINGKKLGNFVIPLPPLPEQKRIVKKLDDCQQHIDTSSEALNKLPKLLEDYRASLLASAFRGDLTVAWREQQKAKGIQHESAQDLLTRLDSKNTGKLKLRGRKENIDNLTLPDIPSGWSWASNHQLAEDSSTSICAGPFGTIFKAKDFRDSGVPIVFLRHVKPDNFNQNKPKYMDPDVWKEYHQEYSIHGGELLVTKLGDPPGDSCIYPTAKGVSMVTPDVLKMTVAKNGANSKYLMHFFNSPVSTAFVEKLAFGGTRLRIDIPMFKFFPIPLAPPAEQKEIVRILETAFTQIDAIKALHSKLETQHSQLTQSLLSKAFKGELLNTNE